MKELVMHCKMLVETIEHCNEKKVLLRGYNKEKQAISRRYQNSLIKNKGTDKLCNFHDFFPMAPSL